MIKTSMKISVFVLALAGTTSGSSAAVNCSQFNSEQMCTSQCIQWNGGTCLASCYWWNGWCGMPLSTTSSSYVMAGTTSGSSAVDCSQFNGKQHLCKSQASCEWWKWSGVCDNKDSGVTSATTSSSYVSLEANENEGFECTDDWVRIC